MNQRATENTNEQLMKGYETAKISSNYDDMPNKRQSKCDRMLSTKELDSRQQLRYKGQAPRKRIASNLNYYDHNILGLANRLTSNIPLNTQIKGKQENQAPIFDSIDNTVKRSKSQPAVIY